MRSASRSPFLAWPRMFQRWRSALVGLHGVVVLAMLLAFLPQPQPALAASLTVTTTTDSLDAAGGCPAMTIASLPGPDGVVSLREAICAANNTAGADTITFGVNGTFPITRLGEDDANDVGDFDLKSNITITGNGAANTIIDGRNNDRVFDTFGCGACTINISGVTITRGNGNSTNGSVGGGMYIDGGVTVSISNSTVSNSTSEAGGGGGINNSGILTLNTVTLSGNSSLAQGGGLRNSGKLAITNSTFSNNSADEGGGLWTSTFSGDAVSITSSTFQGNTTVGIAGGISGDGGGLYIGGDAVYSLSTSTISGNIAGRNGGGVFLRDDAGSTLAATTLTNNTISGNSAKGNGGGVYHDSGSNTINNTTIALNISNSDSTSGGDGGGIYALTNSLTVRNSIVAGNSGLAGARPDCGGIFTSGGYNLFGDSTQCPATTGDSNLVTLGKTIGQVLNTTLANNGGPTLTHALLGGSPAIDTGNNATCASTDQRGVARPFGAACDKGSFEVNDTTPPDTTITATPLSPTNDNTPTFQFTGSDNLTPVASLTYECRIDSGAYAACTSPFTSAALADGSHTFQVRAKDQAGNIDPTPATYTFVVDAVAPTSSFTSTPANPTNSTNAAFAFTGNDGSGSGIKRLECSLDGAAFATCTSPQNLTALAEGSHTFAVRAVDNAGNTQATPTSFAWVIDLTAPDTTITANPSALSNNTTASFTFSGTDPTSNGVASGVASFECQLDGSVFTTCTSPRNYTGLSDGAHTFAVRAIDAAGNVDGTPASYTWAVDSVVPAAPVVTTPANGSVTNNPQPPVTGTAEPNSTVTIFIDGAAVGTTTADASGNWAFTPGTPLAQGAHTVKARATDAAGNTSVDSNTNTFTVDTVEPDTTFTSTPPSATNNTSANFQFTGNGTGSAIDHFECSLDGATFATCANPQNLTGLAEGSHTFRVRAVDSAGNTETTPASYTWIVDLTAPDTTITANPPSLSNSQSASFSFTGSDGSGSGVASFECALDGAAFAACTSPANYTGLADGAHTFAVRAIDAAGNMDASPASYTWTIDTVAPDTTITGNPPALSNSQNASFSFTGSDGSGSGIASFECALDGAAFAACTSPANYTGLADGAHTFAVRAIDAAGNM
ncbi:MAG TPA: Ig-like domain-containing protein, partial [Roseiflexaceae bacterium]|nr:Ig-like domain-containing protein [Roseiflexaceae bacterium]